MNGVTRDSLIEDSETSWNNWRGAQSGFLGWAVAGIKVSRVHNLVFRRHVAVGNETGGIWFDISCKNVLLDRCFLFGNRRPGLEFEFSEPSVGGYEVRDSVLANNETCGLFISDASDIRVLNNLIVDNVAGQLEQRISSAQIAFKNQPRRGPDTPEQWGRIVLKNNVIAARGQSTLFGWQYPRTKPEGFEEMLRALQSSDNVFYHPTSAKSFELSDKTMADLDGWRAFLARIGAPSREDGSVWRDPGFAPQGSFDFTDESQSELTKRARAMGVPIPSAAVKQWHAGQGKERGPKDVTFG